MMITMLMDGMNFAPAMDTIYEEDADLGEYASHADNLMFKCHQRWYCPLQLNLGPTFWRITK